VSLRSTGEFGRCEECWLLGDDELPHWYECRSVIGGSPSLQGRPRKPKPLRYMDAGLPTLKPWLSDNLARCSRPPIRAVEGRRSPLWRHDKQDGGDLVGSALFRLPSLFIEEDKANHDE
jgi:hypothetical protein